MIYRIRFHGRGGQGIKTAGRILGTAFFLEGFEVQDAPRYGAERRGAPLFAYVRASTAPINERGIIQRPDLVVVADDTLVGVPAAGVLAGVDSHTLLLIDTDQTAEEWQRRLTFPGRVFTLRREATAQRAASARHGGTACAGAAARLAGVVSAAALEHAVRLELAHLPPPAVEASVEAGLGAYAGMAGHEAAVTPGREPAADGYDPPEWVDLPFEEARRSAPAIHAAATSELARTGLWRTLRPVIDDERCSRCWWVCSTLCPDGAIRVGEGGRPEIDYAHCKGCLVCVAVCPPHAVRAVPEAEAEGAT
jgi:pyruvate ferredoxin oxidoreductase gamma subunit